MLERRAARFWLFFILGLMAVNLAVAVVAIFMASRDPSFRPMPNYGEQAVDWQSHRRLLEQSEKLGWQLQLERAMRGATGTSVMEFRLKDREGVPISDAIGTAQAYHFTRVDQNTVVDVIPVSEEPGLYRVPMDVSRDGKWQVAIDLRRGNSERFVHEEVMDWSSL
jgi:nitrogen fixation protein FixH